MTVMAYPNDPAARKAERDAIEALAERAADQAALNVRGAVLKHGRSPECRGEANTSQRQNVTDHAGCTEKPAACICWCHDLATSGS